MQSIGNYLKSGREARNIRLSEVARSTKISKWYLDCLEKDDFDKIPGGPYIKGYIASYAAFIGIEEDEILKRYDSLQINHADESDIQDHQPLAKKRPKFLRFSLSKKYLLVLSMAVLILLAFGFTYFYFQNQTPLVAQLKDAQSSKMQPAPSSKIKQEAESASPLRDVSKNNLPPKKTGAESPALLPSKKEVDGALPAFVEPEKDIHSQTTINQEPVILDAQPSSQNNTDNRAALTNSKNTSHPGTADSADLNSETTLGYRAQETGTQAASNIRVLKAVAASDVIDKNPSGTGYSFQWTAEKVYVWSMIECKQPPASIRHTYYFNGKIVNDVLLKINSPRWRTWSFKTLLEKRWIGQWRVDITSVEGELLQRVFFEIN